MAAPPSLDLVACEAGFALFAGRIAGRFRRVEPRRHASALVRALIAELPRVNCWTLAEHAGYASPDAFQHLLSRARWDHDGVRDDLREFVTERLGTENSVLVIDETGDVKKGTSTVGTQRQYTGTAGRIENAQVAVYAVWATRRGAAFVDRELYVPASWTDDPARCQAAGLPDALEFATKPALALGMVERALAAGARPDWVAADEVYGNNSHLRDALEDLGVGYVLAVSCSTRVAVGPASIRADALARALSPECWQIRSAGAGAKGQRWYQWAYMHLQETSPAGGQRYLLIRRNRTTGELAFYRCWAPHPVPLAALVTVAGTRWKVEESFQTGKGLTGLDEHQVRRYTSWARWTVLVMLAHAFLTATVADQPGLPADTGMVPLTRNEITHLLAALTLSIPHPPEHRWAWSTWRRRHQFRAKQCHYQRREACWT
ncbi:IS701 family transposase [Streptomyces sp. NPDC005146]